MVLRNKSLQALENGFIHYRIDQNDASIYAILTWSPPRNRYIGNTPYINVMMAA